MCLPNGDHRPAIVVKVWNIDTPSCPSYVNLQVITDGSNDLYAFNPEDRRRDDVAHGHFWATSICFDDQEKKPGTWHWIERA